MTNKIIRSDVAIGIILILSLIVGATFWINNKKQSDQLEKQALAVSETSFKIAKQNKNVVAGKTNTCTPHYYEGKQQISGWMDKGVDSSDGITIQVAKSDVSKFPAKDASNLNSETFTVKLVDATDEVKNQLKDSSEVKPATITIQGYAEICKEPPLVSVQPATVAFKKS